MNPIEGMQDQQIETLLTLFKRKPSISQEQAEALVHALVDIANSMNKLYGEILPRLLSEPGASADVLADRIWDIREELRHVDYHLHDSGVLEL
jgi:hypothetical protein